MSSPEEFYNSLPPVTKAYGTLYLAATAASHWGLINPQIMALDYERVFSNFEVWRLVSNFFFLGPFSFHFGFRFLMLARYGVQLERGSFQRRTATFLWMMIFGALTLLALAAIPMLWTPYLAAPLVFILLYVWSIENANAQIDIYGVVKLKAFYFPWAVLVLDVIYGTPILPAILGILAGHMYYFLTALHPLSAQRSH